MRRFLEEDEAATMVEYCLMIMFIAVVCAAAVSAIGTHLRPHFTDADTCLKAPGSC